jgi:hypothetical protein
MFFLKPARRIDCRAANNGLNSFFLNRLDVGFSEPPSFLGLGRDPHYHDV